MRAEYRIFESERLAGKMILRPETPEEQAALDDFRRHINSPQRGRTHEVIYRRRKALAGPERIHQALIERHRADDVAPVGKARSLDDVKYPDD